MYKILSHKFSEYVLLIDDVHHMPALGKYSSNLKNFISLDYELDYENASDFMPLDKYSFTIKGRLVFDIKLAKEDDPTTFDIKYSYEHSHCNLVGRKLFSQFENYIVEAAKKVLPSKKDLFHLIITKLYSNIDKIIEETQQELEGLITKRDLLQRYLP